MIEQELNWTEVNPETTKCGWDDLSEGCYVVKTTYNLGKDREEDDINICQVITHNGSRSLTVGHYFHFDAGYLLAYAKIKV